MPTLRRLLLVYNADHSLIGGIKYAAERLRTGQDPCSLCDITYKGIRERGEWKSCKLSFGVPSEEIYRNQLTPEMSAVVDGQFPCVLADYDGVFTRIVDQQTLEACRNDEDSVNCLHRALAAELKKAG